MTKIKINDINSYTDSMKKSLHEKSFFLRKIKADSFLDYGCADGALLKFIQSLLPECKYVGYDISKEMLERAKQNSDITFTDDLDLLSQEKTKNSALILSSIIHEIYSYADPTEFWNEVFTKIDTKYIVIRDMMISDSQIKTSNLKDVKKVKEKNNGNLEDFQDNWGDIALNRNLIHYLLKYRYLKNWNREVKENYLPLTLEQLIAELPENYEIIYIKHYTPRFLKRFVKKDFNIKLKEKTHVKMIIKRK
ncbi:MAG: hypothetical protein KQ78_01768 [Candidatus Izimaplasma bacterium HR2]|nr:MAG: hypothetical protein KQ78_01768 [Candidatus Izimaplasma bacterium HR2]